MLRLSGGSGQSVEDPLPFRACGCLVVGIRPPKRPRGSLFLFKSQKQTRGQLRERSHAQKAEGDPSRFRAPQLLFSLGLPLQAEGGIEAAELHGGAVVQRGVQDVLHLPWVWAGEQTRGFGWLEEKPLGFVWGRHLWIFLLDVSRQYQLSE